MVTTSMLLEGLSPVFTIIIAIAVIVSVFSIFKEVFHKNKRKSIHLNYSKKSSLLTNNELEFYHRLQKISEQRGFILMAKVRMADIILPPKESKDCMILFQKISQKHADFVICDKGNLEPLLVIELDDKSHDGISHHERDLFIDQAYRTAKLPILHVRNSEDLDSEISKVI